MREGIITLLLSFIAVFGFTQITVNGALDNNKILIGDQAVLTLEARYPDDFEVRNIDLSVLDSVFAEPDAQNPDPDPGQLEIMDVGNWDTLAHNGVVTLSGKIRLTCWKKGVYYIPPFIFTFQQTGGGSQSKATNQLALLVGTPIGDTQAADTIQLAPIKDIVEESKKLEDYFWHIFAVLLALGLLALRYFVLKRLKKRREGRKEIFIKRPSHEVALEKLDKLEKAKLWQQGEVKAYQTELTYIIREYLENRYRISALESTTSEIQEQLEPLDFDQNLKGELSNMLQVADMVKFAKAKPPADFHDRVLKQARGFVVETQAEITTVEYVDADGNPVLPDAVPQEGASQKTMPPKGSGSVERNAPGPNGRLICPVTGVEATIPLKLYKWGLSFFGFKLTTKKVPVSNEGLEKHKKVRSPFWSLVNPVGNVAVYIPFIGGYILMALFLLAILLMPIFIVLDLVQGRKPLSRGLLTINRKGELITKSENHVD